VYTDGEGASLMECSKTTDEFLRLFIVAQPRVYAYIRTLLPASREDAEEVQQKTRSHLMISHELADLVSQESISRTNTDDLRWQALEKCMAKLKSTDRELLGLRYRQDGSAKATAEAFGRSVESVRHSLLRIRLALLACVQRTRVSEVRA